MELRFILEMNPPTITAQEHKVIVRNGKPIFYDPPELADAKEKIKSRLAAHVPDKPLEGPLALMVSWLFLTERHPHMEWRTTKPDTDNLQKGLKDCMTQCHFWGDDAQVVQEQVEKRWVRTGAGIYIRIKELGGDK